LQKQKHVFGNYVTNNKTQIKHVCGGCGNDKIGDAFNGVNTICNAVNIQVVTTHLKRNRSCLLISMGNSTKQKLGRALDQIQASVFYLCVLLILR
jgi:hypothetical protein